MTESEEELKSLLMNVKEDGEKAGLKLNIQKTKIMAFSPITSWQIDGETVETVTDFIFLGCKVTADGDSSHEIKNNNNKKKKKKHLFLGRKAMTNLDIILKKRDIALPTKVHLVKAMVFPAVRYGYEPFNYSVMSDLLQPHGLKPARLLHPWNSPSKNTGVGCHFLL